MTSKSAAPTVPEQIIQSMERLLAKGGLANASLNAIAAESGVPRGSILYYFPGGKDEIVQAALKIHEKRFSARMKEVLVPGEGFAESLSELMQSNARKMKAAGFVSGCPVAGVVLDLGEEDEELRLLCAEIVKTWEAAMAGALTGLDESKRKAMGEFIFAAYEGAILMAKLKKSTAPLLNAARHLVITLRALA
jgi:TetR/AcrR family transcriptional repressor of lmrAB and yxaGH operons